MKSILKAFSALALTGAMVAPALAGTDEKDLKKVIQDQGINYVETAQKGITLSGYVDTSFTEQFAGKGQTFATSDGNGNNQHTLRQFDTNADNFNVNAVKIALEKALPDKDEWGAGFRIDTIYGSDAKYLADSAFGTGAGETVALEQALVKFRIPIGNGLDIYMGKFVTFLGYEVIESPANLNFSRGLLFTNLIPLTHTGAYADYKFNDTFEAKFGVVDGWNNSTSTASSDPKASYNFGGKAITGQLVINNPGKNASITTSFIYSPDSSGDANGLYTDNGPSAVFDIWGNWNPVFIKDSALTLGFNIDYGYAGAAGAPGASSANQWAGIALYSAYKFNKVFSLAGRGEFIYDDSGGVAKYGDGGFTTDGAFHSANQYDYSYTLTASFNIWDNLLTRVEYRIDDLSKGTTGTNSTVENEISVNAVYSF